MGGYFENIRPSWIAAILSFVIYLLPLPAHGGVMLLGEALFMEGPPGSGIVLTPMWVASFATTLVLQGLAGALIYWVLKAPGWRRVPMLPVGGLGLYIAVLILFFKVIPALFFGP